MESDKTHAALLDLCAEILETNRQTISHLREMSAALACMNGMATVSDDEIQSFLEHAAIDELAASGYLDAPPAPAPDTWPLDHPEPIVTEADL